MPCSGIDVLRRNNAFHHLTAWWSLTNLAQDPIGKHCSMEGAFIMWELLNALQISLRYDKWSSVSSNEVQLKSHNSPYSSYGPCLRCATTPWKAMLRALVQESHLDLQGMGTPRFDWGICSSCDNEDSHALFDCKMLWAQVQSLAECGIIWIKREIVWKSDCMDARLCPPTV